MSPTALVIEAQAHVAHRMRRVRDLEARVSSATAALEAATRELHAAVDLLEGALRARELEREQEVEAAE